MELGQEWQSKDIADTLANICAQENSNGYCWVDQLCIRQSDAEEVGRTVQRIPQIYRTLDVIAMMPGRPCVCLDKLAHVAGEIDRCQELEQIKELEDRLVEAKNESCVNAWGLSSYFDRLWTRQESLYSSSITVAWTSPSPSPCAQDTTGVGPRYIALKCGSRDGGSYLALAALAVVAFQRSCSLALAAYRAGEVSSGVAVLFLSGATFTRRAQYSQDDEVFFFNQQLSSLGRQARSATYEYDYVAAVWVDLPFYELPLNYKKWRLADLLENAVKQYECATGSTIPVTFVAAFSDPSNLRDAALWRPASYLGEVSISNTTHVYAPALVAQQCTSTREFDNEHRLPISIRNQSPSSLNLRAEDCAEHFARRSFFEVVDEIASIVLHWPDVGINCQPMLKSLSKSNLNDTRFAAHFAACIFTRAMALKDNPHQPLNDLTERTQSLPLADFDHHAAVYELVALALGLNSKVCRASNLRLVLSLGTVETIGLTKASRGEHRRMTVTIPMHHPYPALGDTIPEISFIDVDWTDQGHYRPMTLWAPTVWQQDIDNVVGGMIVEGSEDHELVRNASHFRSLLGG